MAAESSFFARLDSVRRTLASQGGRPSALGSITQLLADPDVRREFFDGLDSPAWILPLRHEGYFEHSPQVQETADGRQVHPQWPEGRYLSRVASQAPADVVSVFLETEMTNVSVVANLVDAAMSTPPEYGAKLVPKIIEAAEANALWTYFGKASDLCVRLAEGDMGASALTLATSLFGPRTGERHDKVSRRDDYWYKDGLRKVVPVLAEREPQAFPRLICGWLEAVVRLRTDIDESTGDDDSYLWRPAIEEHDQNRDYDLAGVLAGFVRQAIERAVASGGLSPRQAVEIVTVSSLSIFRRLRVHFANAFADEDPVSAREMIMDRRLFDDFRFKHEYAQLVGQRFPLLELTERQTWFSWIDGGPDLTGFETHVREARGREATEEERQGRIVYWQFERLHSVRSYLEGPRQEFYARMVAKHGEPELSDLNVRMTVGYGWRDTPIAVDQLSALPFEEAVHRVSSFMPSGDPASPGWEGVAAAFGEYIAAKPRQFSTMAAALTGRPRIYVRAFISQMTSAARGHQDIDVPAILALCRWVVESTGPEEAAAQAGAEGTKDEERQWTRDEVSRFLLAVLQATDGKVPTYGRGPLREQLWSVLEGLTMDPPTSAIVRDRPGEDARAHDYLDVAINSPRGKGVECALEYARWVSLQIKQTSGLKEVVPGGLTAMPEVRRVLELQISNEHRTVEALAVIGARLNLIQWIDRDWLAANLDQLFDLGGILDSPPRTEGWAAWNALLVWVRPRIELYRLLERQFVQGVRLAAAVEPTEPAHTSPLKRLAEHLMVLYGWGEISLEGEWTLLAEFFERARPETRRHGIHFLGEVLSEAGLPNEFVDRCQRLWDYYWPRYGRTDVLEKPGSFLFGPWFSSGRFLPDWAVSRLYDFVGVAPTADDGHDVLKRLAELAPTDPRQVLEILERMLNADREGWRISMWQDPVRSILERGMRADDETRAKAVTLIDQLGRRGFTAFGELLDLGPPEAQ